MFATFMAAIAVWFQSVTTSALTGDASATTRQTFAAAIPLTIPSDVILMRASLVYLRPGSGGDGPARRSDAFALKRCAAMGKATSVALVYLPRACRTPSTRASRLAG